jgi:hypothetical protein
MRVSVRWSVAGVKPTQARGNAFYFFFFQLKPPGTIIPTSRKKKSMLPNQIAVLLHNVAHHARLGQRRNVTQLIILRPERRERIEANEKRKSNLMWLLPVFLRSFCSFHIPSFPFPTSLAATLRRMRRMILPERVLGRFGVIWITSGLANGPTCAQDDQKKTPTKKTQN